MTTDKHVDPAAPLPNLAVDADSNLEDVPEGAVRFGLEPEAIADALAAPSLQVLTWHALRHLRFTGSLSNAVPSVLHHWQASDCCWWLFARKPGDL